MELEIGVGVGKILQNDKGPASKLSFERAISSNIILVKVFGTNLEQNMSLCKISHYGKSSISSFYQCYIS